MVRDLYIYPPGPIGVVVGVVGVIVVVVVVVGELVVFISLITVQELPTNAGTITAASTTRITVYNNKWLVEIS